jgi:hypothetical protein
MKTAQWHVCPNLIKIADKFDLKIITITDLIAYMSKKDSLIEEGQRIKLPTQYGTFDIIPFRQKSNNLEHVALIKGTWEPDEASSSEGALLLSYRRLVWIVAMRLWTTITLGNGDD